MTHNKSKPMAALALCVLVSLTILATAPIVQAAGEPIMTDNEKIIREFIAAWSRLDAAELASYFAVDGTYHNMPSAPVTGQENIARFIAGFIRPWEATEWEIVNLLAEGELVMVERVDRTTVAGSPIDLPVFGVFEMENGKIRVWRDYFDLPTYTEAMTRALQATN